MNIPQLLRVCFLLLMLHGAAAAQQFRVQGRDISFSPDPSSVLLRMSPRADTLLVLLHVNSFSPLSARQQWAASGLRLRDYLGNGVFDALITPACAILPSVFDGIAFPSPEMKIDAALLQLKTARITVLAACDPAVSREGVLSWISRYGGTLRPQKWEQEHLFEIDIPKEQLAAAAAWYGVQWLQPGFTIKALDLDSKASLGAAAVSAPSAFGGYGLLGSDVVIGHGDNCSGIYHVDQQDRVINHNYGGKANHGVLVNGLMGGQGFMDPAGMGIARKSSFVSFFYDEVILRKRAIYSAYNVSLTNNSYRADRSNLCAYTGVYDALSVSLDRLAQANPAQLDVFAASNDGATTCSPYPPGYYTISGGFQTAKNILTVGSCTRELELANSSSRGPLKDGRLKPELVAPGHNIYCPIPDNTYMYEYGTSLACPQAVGILALLTERYRQLRGGTPPGALLKALAINGARDMGRPGPDYWYGFGLINAQRSLAMIDSGRMIEDVADNPARKFRFRITVPRGTAQLKALLYYHDTAASPASASQLVNDLDLRVIGQDSVAHYPLVLNPAPDKAGDLAREGTDRLNNVEQVVITQPAAGDYSLEVSAYALPVPGQRFYVVYDFVPAELKILSPASLEAFRDSSDAYIYWSSTDTVHDVRLQVSEDGVTWKELASLPGTARMYKWSPAGIASGACRIRMIQGTLSDESGSFVVNTKPVLTLASDQCPGSVSFSWNEIRAATQYVVLQKKGADFVSVDTVSSAVRNYTVYGLSQDSLYFFSVQPLLAGLGGYRANALPVRPNKGSCAAAPPGNLAIEGVTPLVGRRFTSTAFSKATMLKAYIRNLDIVPRNYRIRYNLNGTGWKVLDGFRIAALDTDVVSVDTVDLSAVGTYSLVMTVQNKDILDPYRINDTFRTYIRHLSNDTLFLTTPLLEDFENFPNAIQHSAQIALDLTERWDYTNNSGFARFSTRAPVSVFSGSLGSVSLDADRNQTGIVNYFSGLFNLSAFDTSVDEIRFDYDYVLRGIPQNTDSNRVWVRGSDQSPWIPMTAYKPNAGLQRAGTLSLRDLFRRNGQNFSASTQVLFVQSDTSVIAGDEAGTGLSVDNFRLFRLNKDVLLSELQTPLPEECSGAPAPVRVRVRNGVPVPASGITLAYRLDKGPVVSEVLPTVLAADDSLDYTFAKWLPELAKGAHDLQVWLYMPGDEYPENDTLHLQYYISDKASEYPLLETFEDMQSLWYVRGTNPSWELGMPVSGAIDTAASGSRCWKTNLSGSYNSSERSYLVSPCLNTSAMKHPMISFSMSFELEDCFPERCDYLIMEYSVDQGQSWNLLGRRTEGTNWYNKYGDYWSGSLLRWHAASIDLPRAAVLKLRFVLISDRSSANAGVAIDDIHIYDRLGISAAPIDRNRLQSLDQSRDDAGWIHLQRDSMRIASVLQTDDFVQSAILYRPSGFTDSVQQQYVVPRSWNILSAPGNYSAGRIRLYLEDSALDNFWRQNTCASCTQSDDIYRMGITRFDGTFNDSMLSNNDSALSHFIPSSDIQWVPYDKGYYAEFRAIPNGEFWLSDGGFTHRQPLNKPYVTLHAQRYGRYSNMLDWYSSIDGDMARYVLQRSLDSSVFTTFAEQLPSGLNSYQFEDQVFPKYGASVYYRILGLTQKGQTFYTPVKRVDWQRPEGVGAVFPVPSTDGTVFIRWNAAVGSKMPVKIFDMAGRLVYDDVLTANSWQSLQKLDLKHLMKGIYWLRLEWMEQPADYRIQLN